MINLLPSKPIFLLLADSQPFDMSRVLRIEVTDSAGYESDQLTVVLDDAEPHIARPREGAEYQLSLGFLETGLTYIGTYIYEEFERNGFERRVILTAKAADHAKTLKEPKTRAWEKMTVEDIINKVGHEHNLKPAIADKFKDHMIDYMAQSEESDQNFLTRLGKRIGAIIAPKDGHLFCTERFSGKTASGENLQPLLIGKSDLINDSAYNVIIRPRVRYGKIIAKWGDKAAGSTKEVSVKTGKEAPSMTLREVFQTEAEAQKAAEAKANEIKSGEGELTLELIGNPLAKAETPVIVDGVAPDADRKWITASAEHIWDYEDGGGATTTIEAQFGMEEEEEADNAG